MLKDLIFTGKLDQFIWAKKLHKKRKKKKKELFCIFPASQIGFICGVVYVSLAVSVVLNQIHWTHKTLILTVSSATLILTINMIKSDASEVCERIEMS